MWPAMPESPPAVSLKPSVLTGRAAAGLFDLAFDSHEEAGSSSAAAHGEALTLKAGSCIDRYRLVRELGEGGFGIVWLARQTEPIQRDVAIKLIKPGMDSRRVIARFEAERQTLAMMEHRNIAAVLDAGATPEGRPYFVMELVRGEPITTYCDHRSLSIRERLELFILVCNGVQHAHQKAILHRDLKPSNILVDEMDGVPVPKIIDFGIAKALASGPGEGASSMFSGSVVIGTPQYMSPEQAGDVLDVDVCSDIYSMGAIFFELLTGRPPFSSDDLDRIPFHRILQIIHESDPARPSTVVFETLADPAIRAIADARRTEPRKLALELRGDLDWIALKCLEKERERRYESASALAADLQRHLQHEPVAARPPTPIYILKKFIRRNRVAVLAGVLIALALLGGAGAAWWGYLGQEQALVQSRQAEADRRRQVKKTTRFAAFLGDMFREISRRTSSSLTPEAVRSLFDSADERRGTQFEQDAETDMRVCLILAQGYCELNKLDVAEGLFQKALAHLQDLRKDDSSDAAECRFWIVWIHLRRIDEAGGLTPAPFTPEKEMLAHCLQTREQTLPPDDPTLLRTRALQCTLLRTEGSGKAAATLLDSILTGPHAHAVRDSPGYGWLLREQALLRLENKDFTGALADLDQARKILAHGATANQRRQMEADDYRIECMIAIKNGKLDEAEDTAMEELNSRQLWLGYEDPRVLTSIAEIYVSMGRFVDAEPRLRRSVEISRKLPSPAGEERALRMLVKYQDLLYPGNASAGLQNVTALARLILRQGDEALLAGRSNATAFAEADGILKGIHDVPTPYPPEAAGFFSARASLAARRGRYAEAASHLKEAIRAEPNNDLFGFQVSVFHLAAGDEKSYQAERARLLGRLDESLTPESLVWICRAALLRPGIDKSSIEKLRECLSKADLQDARPDDDWAALLQGMARFRAGENQDAAAWLEFAQRSREPGVVLQAQAFMAMNRVRLNQPEAHAVLSEALHGFEEHFARYAGTDSEPPMHDYLSAKFLTEEARKSMAQPMLGR